MHHTRGLCCKRLHQGIDHIPSSAAPFALRTLSGRATRLLRRERPFPRVASVTLIHLTDCPGERLASVVTFV
jgi:hypothetical protein